jgi:hypothetical protein
MDQIVRRRSKNRFGGRASWSLFLNFLKIEILKFSKNPKKILDVCNDVIHSSKKISK